MENQQNAIEVKNVKKYFKVYYDRGITFKDKFLSRGRSRYEKREVLKGISFSVKQGEAIGLIGKNGCGKSTTLKMLTKIIYPNEGSIEMKGRVSSLLELGAGFHPDMSGKENIYMNAAVFGLTRKEIDKRVKDIIKFSELEEFIDNPVRTYSSGMYMRLAFSVAINVDADVLLIDEILAVGDVSFQKKCFEKLKEIKMNGTTIVIVSHSLDQIEKICDRTIWIEDGLIKEEGKPREVHEDYLQAMEKKRLEKYELEHIIVNKPENESTDKKEIDTGRIETNENDILNGISGNNRLDNEKMKTIEEELVEHEIVSMTVETENEIWKQVETYSNLINCLDVSAKRSGNEKVKFIRLNILNQKKEQTIVFNMGDKAQILLEVETKSKHEKGTVGIVIFRDDGLYCYGTNTFIESGNILNFDINSKVEIDFPDVNLLPGKYFLTIGIHDENAEVYDQIDYAISFQIMDNKGDFGVSRIKTEWTII